MQAATHLFRGLKFFQMHMQGATLTIIKKNRDFFFKKNYFGDFMRPRSDHLGQHQQKVEVRLTTIMGLHGSKKDEEDLGQFLQENLEFASIVEDMVTSPVTAEHQIDFIVVNLDIFLIVVLGDVRTFRERKELKAITVMNNMKKLHLLYHWP